jgi:RNA-binding protein
MEEVGVALHLASSGKLILKGKPVAPGTILYDSNGRRIAKVHEVIGPVRNPYLSCKPLTDKIRKIFGVKLYSSNYGN